MFGIVKQRVEGYLREHALPGVTSDRVVTFDVTNRKIDGTCYLFFDADGRAPALVAKAARTEPGRAVFEIEHQNLTTLAARGMNAGRPRVPTALACWRERETVITLQSALAGRLMKNVPGTELFSPAAVEAGIARVMDWWLHLQDRLGLERVQLVGETYEQHVARPARQFQRRFLLDDEEQAFLQRWCAGDNALCSAELPLMAGHGDFCAANMVLLDEGLGVFDWEFPLRHEMPLFDLFFFFSSVRFPFVGRRGESSHFDSFKHVFWSESYFRTALCATLDDVCRRFVIPRDTLGDLLVLSAIRVANMKYEGLLTSHGLQDLAGDTVNDQHKRERWRAFDNPDKDAPFACIPAFASRIAFVASSSGPGFSTKFSLARTPVDGCLTGSGSGFPIPLGEPLPEWLG